MRFRKATARCWITAWSMAFTDQSFAKIHAVDGLPIFVAGGASGRMKAGYPCRGRQQSGVARRPDDAEGHGHFHRQLESRACSDNHQVAGQHQIQARR